MNRLSPLEFYEELDVEEFKKSEEKKFFNLAKKTYNFDWEIWVSDFLNSDYEG